MCNLWRKFHTSFHDSEVILWARLQFAVGCVWEVLIQFDLSPIVTNPKYLTAWLIFSGIVTEWTRRTRATDLDVPHEEPK